MLRGCGSATCFWHKTFFYRKYVILMSYDSKRDLWKWIINLIASVLTALAAALGTASCVTNGAIAL